MATEMKTKVSAYILFTFIETKKSEDLHSEVTTFSKKNKGGCEGISDSERKKQVSALLLHTT